MWIQTYLLPFAVPGKPPANISADSVSSTTIQVTWLCIDCHQHNLTVGFRVSYKLEGSNQTTAVVVNRTVTQLHIIGLRKFTKYTVYVSSVTERGISMSSEEVSTRTLEDGMNVQHDIQIKLSDMYMKLTTVMT